MPRTKFSSPTLDLQIKTEDWEKAKAASSGGCLIADAIKKQYPHLSNVSVDAATVRASDRKRGLRFVYLTPEPAQMLLLAFDQGWGQTAEQIRIARAAQVFPITSGKKDAEKREQRKAEIEAKVKAEGKDSLTKQEKSVLTKIKKTGDRPTRRGKPEISTKGVVHGGAPITQATKVANPNLLRGRDRVFGAKRARPAEVFERAVEVEVEARVAAALESAGVDPVADAL